MLTPRLIRRTLNTSNNYKKLSKMLKNRKKGYGQHAAIKICQIRHLIIRKAVALKATSHQTVKKFTICPGRNIMIKQLSMKVGESVGSAQKKMPHLPAGESQKYEK